MDKLIRTLAIAAALACIPALSTGPRAYAQSSAQADNSAQNKTQNQCNNADKQPQGKSDIQITAQIRRAIIADKDLSMYAHNVKIITKGGAVTLKGPVKSDDEKQKVGAIATGLVSANQVTNQLTVKQ